MIGEDSSSIEAGEEEEEALLDPALVEDERAVPIDERVAVLVPIDRRFEDDGAGT